jgi:hypothetical protein
MLIIKAILRVIATLIFNMLLFKSFKNLIPYKKSFHRNVICSTDNNRPKRRSEISNKYNFFYNYIKQDNFNDALKYFKELNFTDNSYKLNFYSSLFHILDSYDDLDKSKGICIFQFLIYI